MEQATQTFTPEQLKHFKAYLRVQRKGDYNMFDPRAIISTGLSKEQYMFVLNNYEALEKASN